MILMRIRPSSCDQLQQGQHGTAFFSHQEQGTAPGFPLPIAQSKMMFAGHSPEYSSASS